MKTLKIIWAIILNLVTFFVILAVFGVAQTRFEKIVIAILLLIYLQVISFYSFWARTTFGIAVVMDNEFKQLKQFHKPEIYMESDNSAEEKLKNSSTEYWINMCFILVFFLIALLNIITNIG